MSDQMKPVHRRDIIRAVRNRWLEQYRDKQEDETTGWNRRLTFGQIRSALKALDLATCAPEDVDAALGTKGWGSNNCDECGKDQAVLLRLGQEPDYEARYWEICTDCLEKALKKLVLATPKP